LSFGDGSDVDVSSATVFAGGGFVVGAAAASASSPLQLVKRASTPLTRPATPTVPQPMA
jgi:hypothetical protein